jgi:hypothetical protein
LAEAEDGAVPSLSTFEQLSTEMDAAALVASAESKAAPADLLPVGGLEWGDAVAPWPQMAQGRSNDSDEVTEAPVAVAGGESLRGAAQGDLREAAGRLQAQLEGIRSLQQQMEGAARKTRRGGRGLGRKGKVTGRR